MAAVTRYDAKTPNFKFRPDSEAKQRAATTLVRAIASACLGKTYGQSNLCGRIYSVSGSGSPSVQDTSIHYR